jgi:putative addiction module component (TIGR02574 family)
MVTTGQRRGADFRANSRRDWLSSRLCQTARMARPALDIQILSPEERLDLIGELWDSLEAQDLPMSDDQRAELDRRIADVEAGGPKGSPWAEVEARIRSRVSSL